MKWILALALLATPAFANTPCLPTMEAFAQALEGRYGETPQLVATMQQGAPFLLFANLETGTWTVVIQSPDGRYCSPASGHNYTAAKQGDPT